MQHKQIIGDTKTKRGATGAIDYNQNVAINVHPISNAVKLRKEEREQQHRAVVVIALICLACGGHNNKKKMDGGRHQVGNADTVAVPIIVVKTYYNKVCQLTCNTIICHLHA